MFDNLRYAILNLVKVRAQLFERRLNFNPGFFIFLSKALSQIIFSFLFRVSNYQIVAKEN